MSEYTPSTAEVRETWAEFVSDYYEGAYQDFDRWLASVKAEAWDEGFRYAAFAEGYLDELEEENPYREEPK